MLLSDDYSCHGVTGHTVVRRYKWSGLRNAFFLRWRQAFMLRVPIILRPDAGQGFILAMVQANSSFTLRTGIDCHPIPVKLVKSQLYCPRYGDLRFDPASGRPNGRRALTIRRKLH